MRTITDIIGVVFGSLTVVKRHPSENKKTYWECLCSCGRTTIVDGYKLKTGHTKSCGCYLSVFRKTHGHAGNYSRSKEYSAWAAMIKRCFNTTDPGYSNYGGRGITVCERWKNSYENFLSDMGSAPSKNHSIDRFPNNDSNYEPTNCRWATTMEQNRNHRRNRHLEHKGRIMILKDWAKELGVGEQTISNHLKSGEYFDDICKYFMTDLFKIRQAKGKSKKINNETTIA